MFTLEFKAIVSFFFLFRLYFFLLSFIDIQKKWNNQFVSTRERAIFQVFLAVIVDQCENVRSSRIKRQPEEDLNKEEKKE